MHHLRTRLFGLMPGLLLVPFFAGFAASGSTNADDAAVALTRAQVTCPKEASGFWLSSDGLAAPDDPRFAEAAAQLAAAGDATSWKFDAIASRQCKCLAYLAAGSPVGRLATARLCVRQAALLLRDLPVRTGHGHTPDRSFCAAAGALALTGAILRREPSASADTRTVATQWLQTGAGQLTTYSSKVKDPDKALGEALLKAGGIDVTALSFQLSDADFFAELDLARPDMRAVAAAVAASDYESAGRAYADALSERFSASHGWPDVNFEKAVNMTEADDICRNVFLLQSHMFRRMDFGREVDWTQVVDGDVESRVWMNAHPWMLTLLNAYRDTRDDKYVAHLCRLFRSWHDKSPPTLLRSNAQWRTLEAGNRVGQKWPSVLLGLSEHPLFKRECLYLMARSMMDHGKYLCTYTAGGGNWLQVESSGLACVALLFPEFKLSPVWYDVAMQRLVWVNERSFLSDGFQSECSPGYHYFPLMGMAGALRLANHLRQPVPGRFMKQYEAAVEALQFIAYPDGTLPMLSDFNPCRQAAFEAFKTGVEVFGRTDFLWLASGGQRGQPPAQTSHDFTHAGYCVMRDKWGPDGHVLVFDAGCFGAGHQHEDKLSFVFYAGGRELIGDPGIYSYRRDAFEPYWRGSWSHNTITVDGLSQHRALGPAEAMPDPDRRFVRGDGFDFAAGWYRQAYSPRGMESRIRKGPQQTGQADKAGVLRTVQHQRCIFNAKGRYAVICDRVTGVGEHRLDLLFHPSPIVSGAGLRPAVRPVALEIGAGRAAVTAEPDAANVAILPAQGDAFEALDVMGQRDPVRGWFALDGIQPSHDIVYSWRGSLPCHFETVIQPLPAGSASPMKVEGRPVSCRGPQSCAAVACGNDLFLISYDGPAEMTCGDVTFHGTALLLERDRGRVLRAYTVDGRELRIGDTLLPTAGPNL